MVRPDMEDFWDGATVATVGNVAADPIYGPSFVGIPNFASIIAAWNAMPTRTLYLVWPGTYQNNIWTGTDLKNGIIRGMGASPTNVNWLSDGPFYSDAVTLRTFRTKVLFENLRMTSTKSWESTIQTHQTECHIINSKVDFNHSGMTHAINSRGQSQNQPLANPMEFLNCMIRQGHNHFSMVHRTTIMLRRTQFDAAINYHNCHGALPADADFVTTATPGYGTSFGDFIVEILPPETTWPKYAGRVLLSMGQGRARVALLHPATKQILWWTWTDALGRWSAQLPPIRVPAAGVYALYLADGQKPVIHGPYHPINY
jgi:hypothetical protein